MADAVGTAEVAPDRVAPRCCPTWATSTEPNGNLLAPASLEMERTLLGVRTDLALAYARENGVNRIEGARDAWLGIVAAGQVLLRPAARAAQPRASTSARSSAPACASSSWA